MAAFFWLRGCSWAGAVCAAPLDWRGDPLFVANLVKTEMRLPSGGGREVVFFQSFEPLISGTFMWVWVLLPLCAGKRHRLLV